MPRPTPATSDLTTKTASDGPERPVKDGLVEGGPIAKGDGATDTSGQRSSEKTPVTSTVSRDAFWGSQIMLSQPQRGFRAGTASVLLAAWLPVNTKGRLIDLGAGVGTLGLLAASRLPGLQVHGFERVPEIAALARQNAHDLGLSQRVTVTALDVFDASALEAALEGKPGQALVCNPPFTGQAQGRRAVDAYRASAHQRAQALQDWFAVAKTCLVAGGWSYWVLPASQVQDALQAASRCDFGAAKILPVQSFAERPARLVLLALRKNRRGDSQILPPLVLYDGPGQQSAQACAILRQGRGIWEVFPALSPT